MRTHKQIVSSFSLFGRLIVLVVLCLSCFVRSLDEWFVHMVDTSLFAIQETVFGVYCAREKKGKIGLGNGSKGGSSGA